MKLLFKAANFFDIYISVVKPQSKSKFFEVSEIISIYFHGFLISPKVLCESILKTKCASSLEWRQKITSFVYSVHFKKHR